MEKKTGYDAVVFDMDGVIFDSERAVMQCWKELADKYQIPESGAFLYGDDDETDAGDYAGNLWGGFSV